MGRNAKLSAAQRSNVARYGQSNVVDDPSGSGSRVNATTGLIIEDSESSESEEEDRRQTKKQRTTVREEGGDYQPKEQGQTIIVPPRRKAPVRSKRDSGVGLSTEGTHDDAVHTVEALDHGETAQLDAMSGETTAGIPQDIVVPDVQVEDSAQGPTTKATAKKVVPPKKATRGKKAKDEKAGENWVKEDENLESLRIKAAYQLDKQRMDDRKEVWGQVSSLADRVLLANAHSTMTVYQTQAQTARSLFGTADEVRFVDEDGSEGDPEEEQGDQILAGLDLPAAEGDDQPVEGDRSFSAEV